jgi:hypothetical protein
MLLEPKGLDSLLSFADYTNHPNLCQERGGARDARGCAECSGWTITLPPAARIFGLAFLEQRIQNDSGPQRPFVFITIQI